MDKELTCHDCIYVNGLGDQNEGIYCRLNHGSRCDDFICTMFISLEDNRDAIEKLRNEKSNG